MANRESHNSLTYQTIPPTTVMMAGNNKEDSPMRIDNEIISSNANVRDAQAADGIPKMSAHFDGSNVVSANMGLQGWNEGSTLVQHNGLLSEPEVNSLPETRPASNVIVDDSPLQLQMEKNKECKSFA